MRMIITCRPLRSPKTQATVTVSRALQQLERTPSHSKVVCEANLICCGIKLARELAIVMPAHMLINLVYSQWVWMKFVAYYLCGGLQFNVEATLLLDLFSLGASNILAAEAA